MNERILIVDDDAQIRGALRKALRIEGYDVVVAADGEQGIEKFEATPIDLLLLDLQLPDQSGWDTFERLTSVNPLVPVVIITGRRDQLEPAAMAGVAALFEKPLDVPLLLRTIRQLLAEQPENHLKRLGGTLADLRYVKPGAT